VTDERRVEVAAEADAAHLMWRGEPQHKPTRWTCSGCGTVVTSPAERDASRTAHAALIAGIETGLRESACAECDHDRCATYRSAASWVRDYAALDRHAPTTGATP